MKARFLVLPALLVITAIAAATDMGTLGLVPVYRLGTPTPASGATPAINALGTPTPGNVRQCTNCKATNPCTQGTPGTDASIAHAEIVGGVPVWNCGSAAASAPTPQPTATPIPAVATATPLVFGTPGVVALFGSPELQPYVGFTPSTGFVTGLDKFGAPTLATPVPPTPVPTATPIPAVATPTPLVFGTPGVAAVFGSPELQPYGGTTCATPGFVVSLNGSIISTCATPIPPTPVPTATPGSGSGSSLVPYDESTPVATPAAGAYDCKGSLIACTDDGATHRTDITITNPTAVPTATVVPTATPQPTATPPLSDTVHETANFTVAHRVEKVTTGSSANITATMPAATGTLNLYRVCKDDTGTKAVVSTRAGSDNFIISGARTSTTRTLSTKGDCDNYFDWASGEWATDGDGS